MSSPLPRRAGLYLRISEDRLEDELAITRQREDGEALITRRGWKLVDTYSEKPMSAKRSGRRPEFDRLLRDVESGRIDAIVVSEMPRLSRNRRDELRIVETCQPRGVVIAVVRGSDFDMSTAAGRLTADVLGSVARHEIDQKSERHRRQIDQAARAGRPHGSQRAFGYTPGNLKVDPVEGPIVAEMFTRWLAGESLGEIAAWLRQIGTTTSRGNRWSSESVKVVLRNPRYAGIRGTRPLVDAETEQRAQWYVEIAPAVWPGIVSEAVWRATLEKLRSGMRGEYRRPAGPGPQHLLSGIATCGVCGSTVIAGSTRERAGSTAQARTYKCRATPGHLSRRAAPLEAYVVTQVLARLASPDAADMLLAAPAEVDVATVRAELAAVRERLRGLSTAFTDQVIDYDQMVVGTRHGKARVAELEAQIAAAGQVDVLAPLVAEESFERVLQHWGSLTMSTQRAVLARLYRVEIRRGRVGRPPRDSPFDDSTIELTPNIVPAGPAPS